MNQLHPDVHHKPIGMQSEDILTPIQIPNMVNIQAMQVSCGITHSVIVDKFGKAHTLGSIFSGKLGMSESELEQNEFYNEQKKLIAYPLQIKALYSHYVKQIDYKEMKKYVNKPENLPLRNYTEFIVDLVYYYREQKEYNQQNQDGSVDDLDLVEQSSIESASSGLSQFEEEIQEKQMKK